MKYRPEDKWWKYYAFQAPVGALNDLEVDKNGRERQFLNLTADGKP